MEQDQSLVDFSVDEVKFVNDGRERHKATLYVQNRSSSSKKIRVAVAKHSDSVFHLLSGRDERYLAAGLKLPVLLQYSPGGRGEGEETHRGELVVYVDSRQAATLPIEGIPPSPILSISPLTVDFGPLVAECQMVTKTFTLTNTGTREGSFVVATPSLPPHFTVSPLRGSLRPQERTEVKVELLCKEKGPFSKVVSILSSDGPEGEELFVVTLCGSIQDRRLRLLDGHTPSSTLEHVAFGHTYYGTTIARKVVLCNDSPVPTDFLAVLDSEAGGSEHGVDMSEGLALACSPGGRGQGRWREQGHPPSSEAMIRVMPTQGRLGPHKQRQVELTFSPSFLLAEAGWAHHQGLPSQRDYALFLKFLPVGVNSTEAALEVAVTGTAVPVDLALQPGTALDFGSCPVDHGSTQELQLCNNSPVLPLEFSSRPVAHYKCDPSSGRVPPGDTLPLSVSFLPRQLGRLNFKLNIDVLGPRGPLAGGGEGGGLKTAVVQTVTVELQGVGTSAPARKSERKSKRVSLAHPSDLATSIRPHDAEKTVVTPFTRVPRHTYVDPDYTLGEEERARRRQHRATYTGLLKTGHAHRSWKEREKTHSDPVYHNPTDLGMGPAQGLRPPKLTLPTSAKETTPPSTGSRPSGGSGGTAEAGGRMVTTRDMLTATTLKLQHLERCGSKLTSPEVATQCRAQLTPEDLSQVHIGPSVVDFGEVVTGAVVERRVHLKNFLTKYISITLKVAGTELCCPQYPSSLPHLTLILPPHTSTEVPFTLQQHSTGVLERSLEYSLNGHHGHHLPVRAWLVPLTLTLSSDTLTLTEAHLATPTAGMRGSVVVRNGLHVAAQFQWHARQGVDTSVFYMMHPSGVVPPQSSLECEFVCMPSFDSPRSAQFMLAVEGEDEEGGGGAVGGATEEGESTTAGVLTVSTQFGKPTCSFREKRVLFGPLPLNLTTTRTVHMENTGESHAYFKVSDPAPYPGMKVYPKSGCVPVGRATELTIAFHPELAEKFDALMSVHFREGRSLSLRLAGTVEEPLVSIDKEVFRFGGVYCGARASIPFTASNKAASRAQLTFDLSYLTDFSTVLPKEEDPYAELVSESPSAELPGVYTLELPGRSSAQCQLEFRPRDIAAHDFLLPVLVNGLKPPSPPPSPWPPSRQPSKVSITAPPHNKAPVPSYGATPTRRVLATALKPPLLISHGEVKFHLPAGYLETRTEPAQHPQAVKLTNEGEEPLTWVLDCSGAKRIQDGTFAFTLHSGTPFNPPTPTSSPGSPGDIGYLEPGKSFQFSVLCSPAHHGSFTASIPLLVNGNQAQPYSTLELSAELLSGKIAVNPSHITVKPMPLGVSVTAQFLVSVVGFASEVDLAVSVPQMEDHTCFTVRFPRGSQVEDCRHRALELPCMLEFSSTKPFSRTDCLVFSDRRTGKRKKVPFTVAADNSIFTVYEFLAQNLNSASIHPNEGGVPSLVLQGPRGLKLSSQSSVSLSSATSLETAPSATITSTFGDMFLHDCVFAVCRWLSAYGWAEGVRSLGSPLELRKRVGNDLPKPGVRQRSNIIASRGILVDLLTHLCGRVPPGIPLNPPPCTTPSEKVNQQYSTYCTVLAFLKSQGGVAWTVVPESLLDYQDWQQWVRDGGGGAPGDAFQPGSEDEFGELSRQAWTHLLMQIIKVLVLPRITSHVPRPLREAVGAMDALGSNVYSRGERVLLAWLNHHWKEQRAFVFGDQDMLYRREVVNFDVDLMDCTVLACVLAAYCPFLVSSYFSRLYVEPSSPEQCSHNTVVFVDALRSIGMDYDCLPNDLCSPNPVWTLLFCGHLFRHLPSLCPRTTLSLQATLHHKVSQQVHLDNPSVKPLVYRVLIRGEGCQDFSIADNRDTITLPPRKSSTLEVWFHPNRTSPSSAVLLLVAQGGRSTSGSSLAFKLQATITRAKPQSSTSVTAALYALHPVALEVTSHFPEGGEFKVQLFESSDKSLLFSPKTKRKTAPRCPAFISTSALQDRSSDQMQLFHSNSPSVHLEPGRPTQIGIQFIPLKLEPRHCAVILSNGKLGELVLSIASSVRLPYPTTPETRFLNPQTIVNQQTKTVHLKVHAGQTVEEEIVIRNQNPAFENAVLEISKRGMGATELRRRCLSQSLRYAALTTAVAALGLEDSPRSYKDHLTEEIAAELSFTVEGSNEFFSLPEVLAVPATQSGSAVLPVRFHAEEEGQYECHVILRAQHDVRVLVIESTVMARGRHAQLEFSTPAMQPLTQDIPIVNPSTVDWPLQASLTGTGFQGPTSLVVRALTTTCYPLTFSLSKEGTVEGKLVLVNVSDNSEHVFQLKGVADRPLAQDHITLQAQAKKSLTHILHVPNHNDRTTLFRVESDLAFLSGPSTMTIGGGDVSDYPLSLLPRRQGVFSGAVAFVAQASSRPHSGVGESLNVPSFTGAPHHVWFQVDCRVEPGPPDHVIPVSCHTLSTTTVQLTVVNPHPDPLSLEVALEGHDGLTGPSRLEVECLGEAAYPLTFAPTMVGKTKGRVVFNGSPDGEFWYQLKLTALNPKTVTLPEVQCELGRTCQQWLTLRNPLDQPVSFTCQSTNTRHFLISGLSEGEVTVAPSSTADVPILFKPSTLRAGEQNTTITFTSEKFGSQVFAIQGKGMQPSTMDPVTVTASLHSNTVGTITFTNPLDGPTHFSVSLRGDDTDHFCLLMKRTRAILLHPGVSLDIPVMFAPENMHRHAVMVVVVAETREDAQKVFQIPLSWRYQVTGQPELRPSSLSGAPKLCCRAKERLEQQLEVSLVGSTASQAAHIRAITPGSASAIVGTRGEAVLDSPREEGYLYGLTCSDERVTALVEQSTGIKLLGRSAEQGEGGTTLVFSIVFVPPKAFSCAVELQVTSSSGGVWKFPLELTATLATPDDIITLEARGLSKKTQVGFRLTSMAEHPVPFTAHLAAGSDSEFSVQPTSGDLAPVHTRGTLFCVTYKPTTYGKDHHAKLVVQSESNEWCYEIVGKPPSYSPPTKTAARVQHKATLPLQVPYPKKNFVRENARLTSRIVTK